MAASNKIVFSPPQLLTSGDVRYYLKVTSTGLVLLGENSVPIYQSHEPVLLAQGMAAGSERVHIVMLKTNGELCYILVSGPGNHQTTTLARLDVRSTRYRRLILLPLGGVVHIFYAYCHQAIPDLWHIEHRFWNGKNWNSVRLGEVVNSKEPLYDISLDNQNNIHLLMMTFQGRHSLLMSNRFHGVFHLWGKPMEALRIPHEVIDMTAIMTPDNVHHLFWVFRTSRGHFDLGWAHRSSAQELAGTWAQAPAAIKSFNSHLKGLGAIESNGGLWLLVNAEQETLLQYKGDGWKPVVNQLSHHRPLQIVCKNLRSYYNTYWLEEDGESHIPAFNQLLGLVPENLNTHSSIPQGISMTSPLSQMPNPYTAEKTPQQLNIKQPPVYNPQTPNYNPQTTGYNSQQTSVYTSQTLNYTPQTQSSSPQTPNFNAQIPSYNVQTAYDQSNPNPRNPSNPVYPSYPNNPLNQLDQSNKPSLTSSIHSQLNQQSQQLSQTEKSPTALPETTPVTVHETVLQQTIPKESNSLQPPLQQTILHEAMSQQPASQRTILQQAIPQHSDLYTETPKPVAEQTSSPLEVHKESIPEQIISTNTDSQSNPEYEPFSSTDDNLSLNQSTDIIKFQVSETAPDHSPLLNSELLAEEKSTSDLPPYTDQPVNAKTRPEALPGTTTIDTANDAIESSEETSENPQAAVAVFAAIDPSPTNVNISQYTIDNLKNKEDIKSANPSKDLETLIADAISPYLQSISDLQNENRHLNQLLASMLANQKSDASTFVHEQTQSAELNGTINQNRVSKHIVENVKMEQLAKDKKGFWGKWFK